MKKKYKVSVIVPVYNVEQYLEQCLKSLVNQTLESLQIIVVNDGSPDNSQDIIDGFIKKYPNKVFGYIKENGGLGDARNYGMQYAEGEYIAFVDSDDWVDEKMFELMYNFAESNRHQIVIADMYNINDGWTLGTPSKGYRGDGKNPSVQDFMLNCLNPAHAWGKLYHYQLLEIEKFPKIWYEDMGCIPVLLSYAESIGYLQIPLYFYRQREGSITQKVNDTRTLQVIQAWENIIEKANQIYREEVIAAVYQSIEAFIYFKPEFAEEFLTYAKEKSHLFVNNKFIQEWIKTGKQQNLMEKELIPKKIHYFWFGDGEKNELFYRCLKSWEKYAPGFEIIEWNESNCDVNECEYVREAYNAKKWAFVSDYFRIKKIYEHGGIYVDTDMEFVNSILPLIVNKIFFAFETKKQIHAGIFGAVPKARIIKEWLDTYNGDHFLNKDGTLNTSNTIVKRLTSLLEDKYKVVLDGKKQKLKDDIILYQPNELTLDMYDGKCIAQHHYEASWWDVKTGNTSYKYEVLKDYFQGGENSSEDVSFLQWKLHEIENSTSWKITKPVRLLADYLKKILK